MVVAAVAVVTTAEIAGRVLKAEAEMGVARETPALEVIAMAGQGHVQVVATSVLANHSFWLDLLSI